MSSADQRPEPQQQQQQQQSTMQASEPASAANSAAATHQDPTTSRKPKEPIKFVAPPPKASPDNPNFKPRQAWPDGKYVKILPQKQLPPGQHRWKGSTGAAPHASQRQPPSRLRSNSGSVNMHSAIALELQSAGNGTRGLAGNGYSRLTGSGGGGGGGDIDNAPEPGEVPAATRKRISYQPGDGYASRGDGYGAASGAGSRPPLLADMYAKQLATGGRGFTGGGGGGGGGGSPANSGGRQRQQQPLMGQYPAGSTFDGAISSFGGASGQTSPLQRPGAHGSSFAEGYDAAGKTITAAAKNQWRLANSRAAVIAALPPGDEGDAARHGFRSRIKKAQQEAYQLGDAAFVAELEEYLQVALGGAGPADAIGGGRRAVAGADAADSFSFGVKGSGAFGSSVSVEQRAEAGAGRGGGGGVRRNVAVFRRGSREVQVGNDGGGSGGFSGGGGSGGGGSGAVGSFKGYKRKAPWQADGGGKAAATHRKVVSMPSDGSGSGGKQKFGKAGPGKPGAGKPGVSKPAAPASQQAPVKKLFAAAEPPPSIGQKLNMSLDAIAGKPAAKAAAKAAAAGGSTAGGAVPSSSGKHQPIAWQG